MTYEEILAQLRKLHGVHDARARAFGSSARFRRQATPGGLPRKQEPPMPGAYVVPEYGVEPNSADVKRFMDTMGLTPKSAQPRSKRSQAQAPWYASMLRSRTGGPQRTVELRPGEYNVAQPPDLFEQAFSSAAGDVTRAREENLKRYAEGHGELTGLRERNQQGWENWGKTQEQLNAERSAEALDRQNAMLASSGIANSNVLPAFAARNARDLALVQQDVAERRQAQQRESDTRDTGNLVGFVERRNDTGPDTAQLLQLALEHGKSVDDAELAAMRRKIAGLNRQGTRRRYRPRGGVPVAGGLRGIIAGGHVGGTPALPAPFVRGVKYTPRSRKPRTSRASKADLEKHLTGKRFIQPVAPRRAPLQLGPPQLGPVYA